MSIFRVSTHALGYKPIKDIDGKPFERNYFQVKYNNILKKILLFKMKGLQPCGKITGVELNGKTTKQVEDPSYLHRFIFTAYR